MTASARFCGCGSIACVEVHGVFCPDCGAVVGINFVGELDCAIMTDKQIIVDNIGVCLFPLITPGSIGPQPQKAVPNTLGVVV